METQGKNSPLSNKVAQADMCAAREKTWDECGIEEKVERLRRDAQDRNVFIDAAYNLGRKAWALLQRHVHAPSGEVYRPVQESLDMDGGGIAGTQGRYDRLR